MTRRSRAGGKGASLVQQFNKVWPLKAVSTSVASSLKQQFLVADPSHAQRSCKLDAKIERSLEKVFLLNTITASFSFNIIFTGKKKEKI